MTTIALTTQNRRHITPHAGRCRHFMVKQVESGGESDWESRSLDKDHTLFSQTEGLPDALRDVDVLITAGAGPGLQTRLARLGVQLVITDILLPEQALAAWRDGSLVPLPFPVAPTAHGHCDGHCKCGEHGEEHTLPGHGHAHHRHRHS